MHSIRRPSPLAAPTCPSHPGNLASVCPTCAVARDKRARDAKAGEVAVIRGSQKAFVR